jgi:hypothetical protein
MRNWHHYYDPAVVDRHRRVARLGGGFNPVVTLFSAGEKGGLWDPSYLEGLFQNSDGTTTVAVGDPVGYVFDRSGNDNHAIQTTSGKRSILRQDAGGKYYLEFDGTDDCLQVASCTLPTWLRLWIAFDTDGAQWFLEHGADANSNDGFYFWGSDNNTWRIFRGGSFEEDDGISAWAGTAAAVRELAYNSSVKSYFKSGTVQAPALVGSTVADSDVTAAFNMCSRNQASTFSQGKLYGLLIRGGVTAAGDVTKTRTWIAAPNRTVIVRKT